MSETAAEDSNIAGTSGGATTGDPLHMPDIIHSDALLPNANDAGGATAAFGLQIPPDNQVNGVSNDFIDDTVFQGAVEPLIDNEKEVGVSDREHAQVDTLDNDRVQDVPSDLQSTDAKGSHPDVVLNSSSGQTYAQAGDDMTQEFNHFVHSDANVFENNDVPTSEITGVEYNQETSGFLQPTEDENAVSAMGDNSGFQENNMDSLMDLDMVNDFGLKDCNVSPLDPPSTPTHLSVDVQTFLNALRIC
jgi:cohesin complex subunit SCC1